VKKGWADLARLFGLSNGGVEFDVIKADMGHWYGV
jgi:hypothetical protein